jgi:hypothetical protein
MPRNMAEQIARHILTGPKTIVEAKERANAK